MPAGVIEDPSYPFVATPDRQPRFFLAQPAGRKLHTFFSAAVMACRLNGGQTVAGLRDDLFPGARPGSIDHSMHLQAGSRRSSRPTPSEGQRWAAVAGETQRGVPA